MREPRQGCGGRTVDALVEGDFQRPRRLHHLHEHDAVRGLALQLGHEGHGVRHVVQHHRAQHDVRRRRFRLLPRLVDGRDVREPGLRCSLLEQPDGVLRRLDDGHAPGPGRQGKCVPARAPTNVEDVGVLPQDGVEAVQHRVVGSVGVKGPVGVAETAASVAMPVAMPVAVPMPAAEQRCGIALVGEDLLAPGVNR